jgi:hypothetical protein
MRIIVPIPGGFKGVILKEGDIVREDLRIARKHRRSTKNDERREDPIPSGVDNRGLISDPTEQGRNGTMTRK